MSELSIPVIDVAALFGGPSPARDRTDAAIMEAASTFGFIAASTLPGDVPNDRESRSQLLRLFDLPPAKIRPLWRQKFEAVAGRHLSGSLNWARAAPTYTAWTG